MKLLFTGILVLSMCFTGYSQDVDLRDETAVERTIAEDNYYVRLMLPFREGKSTIEELKRKLEIELKSSLAKKNHFKS